MAIYFTIKRNNIFIGSSGKKINGGAISMFDDNSLYRPLVRPKDGPKDGPKDRPKEKPKEKPMNGHAVLFLSAPSASRSSVDPDFPILRLRSSDLESSRRILPPGGRFVYHRAPVVQTKSVDQIKDLKRISQGAASYANGGKYVGEYENGARSGLGAYTFANGNNYVGEFKDGKFDGQGTATHTNGNKYFGKFKDGKFHGQGTATLPDGSVKEGKWENGKFQFEKPSPIFPADTSPCQPLPTSRSLRLIGPPIKLSKARS